MHNFTALIFMHLCILGLKKHAIFLLLAFCSCVTHSETGRAGACTPNAGTLIQLAVPLRQFVSCTGCTVKLNRIDRVDNQNAYSQYFHPLLKRCGPPFLFFMGLATAYWGWWNLRIGARNLMGGIALLSGFWVAIIGGVLWLP